MNLLKPIGKLLKWIFADPQRTVKLIIDVIQLIKEAVRSGKAVTVDQLPKAKNLPVVLNSALLKADMTSYYNPHSALLQAQDILTPMNDTDRGRKYEELGGRLLTEMKNIDFEAAKKIVKDAYLEGKEG